MPVSDTSIWSPAIAAAETFEDIGMLPNSLKVDSEVI
jgi:hypothetical protein